MVVVCVVCFVSCLGVGFWFLLRGVCSRLQVGVCACCSCGVRFSLSLPLFVGVLECIRYVRCLLCWGCLALLVVVVWLVWGRRVMGCLVRGCVFGFCVSVLVFGGFLLGLVRAFFRWVLLGFLWVCLLLLCEFRLLLGSGFPCWCCCGVCLCLFCLSVFDGSVGCLQSAWDFCLFVGFLCSFVFMQWRVFFVDLLGVFFVVLCCFLVFCVLVFWVFLC